MCGIVGILARNGPVAPELLEQAARSLAHRGPDDSGTIILQETVPELLEIGLGNRRLAILDLSPSGHQPMKDDETGNWIVYNGEIYNFREIRDLLVRAGVYLRGHSDTEVLLKAYVHWGEECLSMLRGMFAFAIWDVRQRQLFLARDPMGIKPLYYYRSNRHFLFASELRTLLGTGLVPRQLNRAALISFLTFGSVYEPETMVEHVRTLRPGHYLKWKNGDLQETQYWDLTPRLKSSGPCDRAESEQTQAEVQAALEQSVCMQTVSDVPVGVFLSGGIDSSVLAGILSKGKSKVSTFSLVFRETDYSEAEYSRTIARQFNTDHHELVVSQQDALSAIPGAVHAMDQPTIDGFNTFLVSQYTRRAGIKVALSGLGGDELFGGYASFRTVPRMERFARLWGHLPATVRRAAAEALTLTAKDTDHNHKLACLVRGNGNLLHPYFLSRMLFTPDQWNRLVSTVDLEAPRRAEAPLAETLNRAADFDPINRVSYLEARCYMLNTLLRDSDVMSMAHGLEVRVPLVDHCLAEKLFALPGKCKLSETSPKPLLLRALGRSLPPQIVQRRKHGFVLPFDHWLQGEIRGEVDQAFRGIESNPLAAVLSPAAIRQVWANFLAGRTSWSRPWSLYVLCRWCELHSIGV